MQGFLAVTTTLTLWEWCSGSCHDRCQRDGAAGKAAAAEPMLPLQHLTAATPPSTAVIVLSAVAICHQLLLFYLWLSLLVRWCCCLPPISLSLSPSLPLVLVHALSRSFSLFVPLWSSVSLSGSFSPSLTCYMYVIWYDIISYDMIWWWGCSLSLSISRPLSLCLSFWIFLARSHLLYVCDMILLYVCDMIWYDIIGHDMMMMMLTLLLITSPRKHWEIVTFCVLQT